MRAHPRTGSGSSCVFVGYNGNGPPAWLIVKRREFLLTIGTLHCQLSHNQFIIVTLYGGGANIYYRCFSFDYDKAASIYALRWFGFLYFRSLPVKHPYPCVGLSLM